MGQAPIVLTTSKWFQVMSSIGRIALLLVGESVVTSVIEGVHPHEAEITKPPSGVE